MRPLTYVEGFVEGCLERIVDDDPEGRRSSAGEGADAEKDTVLDILKTGCGVRTGRI